MGTRNSTIVKMDGETVVAQYGQWDGYPTGQGQTIVNFLRKADLEKFRRQLKKVNVVEEQEVQDYLKEIGAEKGWVNMEQAELMKRRFPGLNRDEGANILNMIYAGETFEVRLDEDFKNDGLFCEYWYEIDLDNLTVTMNGKVYTFEEWTSKGFMEKLEAQEREESKDED